MTTNGMGGFPCSHFIWRFALVWFGLVLGFGLLLPKCQLESENSRVGNKIGKSLEFATTAPACYSQCVKQNGSWKLGKYGTCAAGTACDIWEEDCRAAGASQPAGIASFILQGQCKPILDLITPILGEIAKQPYCFNHLCQDYADEFLIACNKAGFICKRLDVVCGSGAGHALNIIQVKGNWVVIDPQGAIHYELYWPVGQEPPSWVLDSICAIFPNADGSAGGPHANDWEIFDNPPPKDRMPALCSFQFFDQNNCMSCCNWMYCAYLQYSNGDLYMKQLQDYLDQCALSCSKLTNFIIDGRTLAPEMPVPPPQCPISDPPPFAGSSTSSTSTTTTTTTTGTSTTTSSTTAPK